jgi:branched-chain amino acid transport system substrate-binding protein
VFNIYILSDKESEFIGEYAYNQMGARSAGIFFMNNDSGRGYRDSFAAKFVSLGGLVKLSEGHEQGTTDFRTTIEKFRSSKVDTVFLASYYAESALFLKQSQELGFQAKWLSYSSIETPDFLKIAGEAADGLVYSQPGLDLESNDEITKRFIAVYKKRYEQEPDLWSAQFYDGTRLFWSALSSGAHTGDQIRTCFLNMKEFPGVTGPISFDENNCVTRKIRFKTIRAGAFVYIEE